MKPQRFRLSRARGYRMPPNTRKVDRSTRWGNPFLITTTAANAVGAYKDWLATSGRTLAEAARTELRGKNLACWCPPDQPCHADVLLELANA